MTRNRTQAPGPTRALDGGPIVVIGDALLDIDLTGAASRLCPDDPGPVLEDTVESARPGGAGLAAILASRERSTWLVCAPGRDEDGQRLLDLLGRRVSVLGIEVGRTAVKARVRSGGRTLLRMDRPASAVPEELAEHVIRELPDLLESAAAVLVSDYGLGLTAHPFIRERLRAVAGRVPVVWDPHPRGRGPVPGVTLVTPNQAEASLLSGIPGSDLAAAEVQARALAGHWEARHVVITRGSAPALLGSATGTCLVVPAGHARPGDACGAGDAFAAGAAGALAGGRETTHAVAQAMLRAERFLGEGGVGAPDLLGSRHTNRTPEPDPRDAADVVHRTRSAGGTVVMAGGCFDLLHAGHVAYLQAARSLGDCLVVALNSDASVRRLKGRDRPLVAQEDRARVLAALSCVDAVEVFDEATPARVLARLKPDIFAKGGDYAGQVIPEAETVTAYGGQVVALPALAGRSSTRLMQAARESVQEGHHDQEERIHA